MKNCVLIALSFFAFRTFAQAVHKSINRPSPMVTKMDSRIYYKEKTGELYANYDPRLSFKTLNVFPVFTKYSSVIANTGKSPDFDYILTTAYSDANFYPASHPEYASALNTYFNYKLAKEINNFRIMFRPKITSEDSILFVNELSEIKKLFKDSAVINYKMSDNLYSLLKKYPADNEILVDIIYFQTKHVFTEATNHWSIIKLYIFDLRNRQLISYNYKVELGGLKYGDFTENDVPWVSIKYLLSHYKHYAKQNKKYLKKQKSLNLN
jgi:hypothetical protein